MKITILNAIIFWGGLAIWYVWDSKKPTLEDESWYSLWLDPIFWGVFIFLQLINWVLRKIFHKQVAVEVNKVSKTLEKVAKSTE